MARIPTMKIKADNEQGFVVINKSDFDEGKHQAVPTGRDELKEQATFLGIEFPKNAKKEKLEELIDDKLLSEAD